MRAVRARPHLWLIAAVSLVVPRRLRAGWRREWEAELRHREARLREWRRLDRRASLDLVRRSAGAVRDALWLQPRRLEDEMFQDIKFALRVTAKSPLFTLVVVATLALGVGATTAIFTVIDAAFLRPLPYREADALVHLWEADAQQSRRREASLPDYLDLKGHGGEVFESLAGYSGSGVTLAGRDAPERLQAARVTYDFFNVLGVAPALGRAFAEGEDRAGATPVVVLGHGLWQRKFGGDPQIVGRAVSLGGTSYTVVGVLPQEFQFPPIGDAQVWLPLNPSANEQSRRYQHWLRVVARLRPGQTAEQARAQLGAVARQWQATDPQYHSGAQLVVVPLRDQIVGPTRPVLLVLLGTVAFVLLIACVNVANLLLARLAARRRELVVRLALGASRWRLVRQLLVESLLLAVLGGAAGVLLAKWGVALLVAAVPPQQLMAMPYLRGLGLDWRVLGFACAVTLLTGLVFGVAPALRASKPDLRESLQEGARGTTGGADRRLRELLVVSETALALVLLVGAGLTAKSLVRLLQVNPGFDPANVLMFHLALPAEKYGAGDKASAFYQQLFARLETMPGVEAAGAVSRFPLAGGNTGTLTVEGRPAAAPREQMEVNLRTVSRGYFRAMGLPLVRGRAFAETDRAGAPRVALVNQTLAAKFFAGGDAVGQRIKFPFTGEEPLEIVGVVGDEKVVELDAATTPVVYFPYLQSPDSALGVVVRTSSDPLALADVVRREVRALEPELVVSQVATMEQYISARPAIFMRRYPALLMGVFAAVALALALVGIYGVVSYSVSQRTHEIAVRMALGAGRAQIFRNVIGRGLALVLAGVAAGIVGSLALTRLLAGVLYGVSATDPATFALVAVALVAVACAACYLPARRATRVDPMDALRYE